jgi:hypothetical protein
MLGTTSPLAPRYISFYMPVAAFSRRSCCQYQWTWETDIEAVTHLLGALQAVLELVDDEHALGAPREGALRCQDAHCRGPKDASVQRALLEEASMFDIVMQ